jgi:hypothetical protein
VLESDPREGVAQVTPALLLSLVRVAVRVTASLPSTVVDDDVTETLMGLEPPVFPPVEPPLPLPQPERLNKARIVMTNRLVGTLVCRPEGRDLDLDIWLPFNS